jgi:hypothetical protein
MHRYSSGLKVYAYIHHAITSQEVFMQKLNGKPRAFSLSLEQFKAAIENRAKDIFLKRKENKVPGDALSDWLQAERTIKEKYRIA